MKPQNRIPKTVYFLGAGFSRGAQYPLQNGLIQKIRNYSPENILSVDLEMFSAFSRFFKQKRQVENFLDLLFPGTESPNLEDIFTLLDQSISERTYCRGIPWTNLIEIDESFKSAVLFSLHESAINVSQKDKELYLKIAGHLLQQRLNGKEKISVISVNWDSLVEDSIYHWIKTLSKVNEPQRIDIDYCCYTMAIGESPHVPSITQKAAKIVNFKILKLHGSTNWLVCESCKKIYTGVGSDQSAFQLYFRPNQICEECKSKSTNDGPRLLPFIITPTYLKAFPNPHIQNVWLNAYTELNEADKIVFIGYSLPEADFFVRSLLKRAIKPEAKIEAVLWKGDRPTKGEQHLSHLFAKHRYEAFFGSQKPEFNFKGVESYFSDKTPDKLAQTKQMLSKLKKKIQLET